jgi:hypothetical protein
MSRCLAAAAALVLLAGACGGDDERNYGTRGNCFAGGAINECDDPELTPEGVCEKMVACGAIARDSNNEGGDYDSCVSTIYQRGDDGTMDFIIACIAATSCDELRSDYCFELGEN